MTNNKVAVFKPDPGAALPSGSAPIQRQELIASSNTWVGVAYTKAGLASAWHHHSENDTYGYVISGRLRIEFGPGGKEAVEIGPGEVFHVPSKIVHREVTGDAGPAAIFVVRSGTGNPVVNVDEPEQGAVAEKP